MKNKGKLIFKCFMWNLIIGALAIVPFMIKENGCFLIGTDYDSILSLWERCRRSILQGNVFWSWSTDLGSDFIGAFSFLALGSPLFWITVLLPKVDYIYLGGWILILKYAIAGLTSGIYLSRFEQKPRLVIMGSILYSFSGFQAANLMMASFHDVVAFFPLLLVGLEICVTEKKKGFLAASVCINALTNFYFFVGEVIFVILYFIIRFVFDDWRYIKKAGKCILEGIVGVFMSAALFFPAILFVLENPRGSSKISLIHNIFPDGMRILKLWRAFLFPGEAMQNQTCVQLYDWSSCSAWLPLVGISLVIAYILNHQIKKDWLKRFIIFISVWMLVPALSSVFTLMTDIYYRWYYMPLLIFALASIRVIEKISEYSIRKITILMSCIMSLSVVAFLVWDKYKFPIIFNMSAFLWLSLIGIIGIVFTGIIAKCVKDDRREKIYFVSIACFAIASTVFTIGRYQECRGYTVKEYQDKTIGIKTLASFIDMDQTPYSIQSIDSQIAAYMDIPFWGSSYNSVQGSIFEMWRGLGEERRVVCPEIPDGYENLTGAKYVMNSVEMEGYTLVGSTQSGEKTYYLYETDTRPIGVAYEYYILQDEFEDSPVENRVEILQQAIVVKKDDAEKVGSYMKRYEPGSISTQTPIENYHKDASSFRCKITADQEKMCFFAVPYARGWKAYVNGKRAKIYDTNGFMAVEIAEGINEIEFRYFNNDFLIGAILSVCGWIVFAVMILKDRKRKAEKGLLS